MPVGCCLTKPTSFWWVALRHGYHYGIWNTSSNCPETRTLQMFEEISVCVHMQKCCLDLFCLLKSFFFHEQVSIFIILIIIGISFKIYYFIETLPPNLQELFW